MNTEQAARELAKVMKSSILELIEPCISKRCEQIAFELLKGFETKQKAALKAVGKAEE